MNPYLAFVLVWTLKTAVVASVGLIILAMMPKAASAWRNSICRLSLVAVVLVPVWMGLSEEAATLTSHPILRAPQLVRLPPLPLPTPTPMSPPTDVRYTPPTFNPPPFDWGLVVLGLYGLVTTYFVVRLGSSVWLAQRQVCIGQTFEESRFGVPKSIRVLEVEGLGSPAVFGNARASILLPSGAWGWPKDRLEMAIRHEWAHIERRDWVWQICGQVVTALQWFNPFVRALSSEMCGSAELAADAFALRSGIDPQGYAVELLEFACGQISSPAVVAMARPHKLRIRIGQILELGSLAKIPNKSVRLATSVGLFSALALVSAALEHGMIPNSRVARFGDGSAFYGPAKISHGDEIKLEYVADWNARPNGIWLPDGNAVSARTRAESIQVSGPVSPNRALHFRVSKSGKRDARHWTVRVPFLTQYADYMTYGEINTEKAFDMAVVVLPPSLDEMDLRVGYAGNKPWELAGQWGLKVGSLDAHVIPNTWTGVWQIWCGSLGPIAGSTDSESRAAQTLPKGSGKQTPRLAMAGAPANSDEVSIEFSVPKELEDSEVFLKAYTRDALGEHELGVVRSLDQGSGSSHYPDDKCIFVFQSDGNPISRVELMARPYEWATFRDVHLRPN